MADDVFRLPQSSYDTICRIIQAYAQVGEKTSLATISKILGHDTTVISRNVQFLLSVGLLEGGRDKGPTTAGMRLGRALEFHEQDDVAAQWRDVLSGHTLVQRILSAIRIRGGMDATTLQGQIVYTAGVNKTSGSMTGGLAVVEMLKAGNLISERDGKFIVPSATDVGLPDEVDVEVPASTVPTSSSVVHRVVQSSPGGVSISVEVQVVVQTTPDELSGIASAIRSLLADLQDVGAAVNGADADQS